MELHIRCTECGFDNWVDIDEEEIPSGFECPSCGSTEVEVE